jgi:hypothetical protein
VVKERKLRGYSKRIKTVKKGENKTRRPRTFIKNERRRTTPDNEGEGKNDHVGPYNVGYF